MFIVQTEFIAIMFRIAVPKQKDKQCHNSSDLQPHFLVLSFLRLETSYHFELSNLSVNVIDIGIV